MGCVFLIVRLVVGLLMALWGISMIIVMVAAFQTDQPGVTFIVGLIFFFIGIGFGVAMLKVVKRWENTRNMRMGGLPEQAAGSSSIPVPRTTAPGNPAVGPNGGHTASRTTAPVDRSGHSAYAAETTSPQQTGTANAGNVNERMRGIPPDQTQAKREPPRNVAPPPMPKIPKTVVCDGCGAKSAVLPAETKACEYCGLPIVYPQ